MSEIKQYMIPVEYVFSGKVCVKAGSREEAEKIARDQCGLNMGEFHTANDDVVDWDIDMHPLKHFPGVNEYNFDQIYKPIKNHLDDNASADGFMFETYNEELDFILETNKTKPNHVWTIISLDNGNQLYATGYHIVDRLGYMITAEPWESDADDIVVDLSNDDPQVIIIDTPDDIVCNILSNKPETEHPVVIRRCLTGISSVLHHKQVEVSQDDDIDIHGIQEAITLSEGLIVLQSSTGDSHD